MAVRFSGRLTDEVIRALANKIVDEGWSAAKSYLVGSYGGQNEDQLPAILHPGNYYYTYEYGYLCCYYVDMSRNQVVRCRWVCYQQHQGLVCRWELY